MSHFWILVPLGLWLALLLAASYLGFWTDSEMWPVSATKYLFATRDEYYFGTKPLFHFLLFGNYNLAHWLGFHPMETARALMMVNTLGLLSAFALILRREGGAPLAVVGLAVLASLSFFVKRSGHVRSDIMAAHLILWCLYFAPLLARRWHYLVWTLGLGCSLLMTPKAVIWLPGLLPFYRNSPFDPRKVRYVLGGLSAVAILALFFSSGLKHFVSDPLEFFYRSFAGDAIHESYFSLARLLYVDRFVRENPHFILAYVGFTLWAIRARKQFSQYTWRVQILGWILTLVLVVYPDRLPFLICALLPFWVLQILLIPPVLRLFKERRELARRLTWVIAGAGYILCLHWALLTIGSHSSIHQRRIVNWLQTEFNKYPKFEIYDPIGILPLENANYWFLGPGQSEKNRYVMHYIQERKPEVIFYTTKVTFLEPMISDELHANYKPDGSGIFVRRMLWENVPSRIDPAQLRQRLVQQFPRLIGDDRYDWQVEMEVLDGLKLRKTVKWQAFAGDDELVLPPGVSQLSIFPLQLALPFSSDIFTQFRFDAEF